MLTMISNACLNLPARLSAGTFAIFLAAATIFTGAARANGVNKPIQYNEHEAPYVSKAFDSFIRLIEKRELPANTLSYPTHLLQINDETVVISQLFYVTPTETRGFELTIPRDVLYERESVFFQKETLVVENENTQQNMRCLTLRKKSSLFSSSTKKKKQS
jgi:hypothetical protein